MYLDLSARKLFRRFIHRLVDGSATLLALMVTLVFIFTADQTGNWKASESHLAAAQVIGAALALVLSLSIIPAQRAAELFSMVILKLYGKDRALIAVFLVLVATTMLSLLLGTGWLTKLDAKSSLSIQFILLGVSFDALRHFYLRVLDLLAPQTAIQLVIRECEKQLVMVQRTAEQLVAIQNAAGIRGGADSAARAALISGSHVPQSLRYWSSQLEEFAHRFVTRRDTSAVIEIISALESIAKRYSDLRKSSVVLHIDVEYPLAGGVSDISDVLNPIYESVLLIADDAISATNERVVRNCIDRMGEMTAHSMSVVALDGSGQKTAPLAYSACYYLDRTIQSALKANMLDAVLAGINRLEALLLKQSPEVTTDAMAIKANETLFSIALAGYVKQGSLWTFKAVSAMLRSVNLEIQQNEFDEGSFRDVLASILQLAPFEIVADKAGKRRLETFPAYSLGFESSIPLLLELIAGKVRFDEEHEWIDPFYDFSKAAEIVRGHYRSLSQLDFQDTLLGKWVVDSLDAVLRVQFNLLTHPPTGSEKFVSAIENDLRALISWMPGFFSEEKPFVKFYATDAANHLAILGMNALDGGWIDVARSCAKAVAELASNSIGVPLDTYAFADMQERLEMLARAADATGQTATGAEFRGMIARPSKVSDQDWPHFLDARKTRFRQLDEALRDAGRGPYRRRDDPVEALHALTRKKRI
ncbi:MAG TPA: hypothetical protein VGO49_18100 [Bradyrhizobium sp.]|jgi:hypothetical protein|nr:hypothetical protein [Bradyrhizobium sp.]